MFIGHTFPSTTQVVFDQIAELKSFYLVLQRSDQLILDSIFDAFLQHHAAINNTSNLLPMEVLPFAIVLEEHKRIAHICNELVNRIEGLENNLKLIYIPEGNENSDLNNT